MGYHKSAHELSSITLKKKNGVSSLTERLLKRYQLLAGLIKYTKFATDASGISLSLSLLNEQASTCYGGSTTCLRDVNKQTKNPLPAIVLQSQSAWSMMTMFFFLERDKVQGCKQGTFDFPGF